MQLRTAFTILAAVIAMAAPTDARGMRGHRGLQGKEKKVKKVKAGNQPDSSSTPAKVEKDEEKEKNNDKEEKEDDKEEKNNDKEGEKDDKEEKNNDKEEKNGKGDEEEEETAPAPAPAPGAMAPAPAAPPAGPPASAPAPAPDAAIAPEGSCEAIYGIDDATANLCTFGGLAAYVFDDTSLINPGRSVPHSRWGSLGGVSAGQFRADLASVPGVNPDVVDYCSCLASTTECDRTMECSPDRLGMIDATLMQIDGPSVGVVDSQEEADILLSFTSSVSPCLVFCQ
jgi:hypothetical protein